MERVRVRLRIVLVDDQRFIREMLSDLLGNEPDLQVVGTATNGVEALELTERARPDVVVMDMAMPVMNGADAAAEILSRWPATRVVALAAAPSGHLAAQAQAAGVTACVSKTAPYSTLLRAVRAG